MKAEQEQQRNIAEHRAREALADVEDEEEEEEEDEDGGGGLVGSQNVSEEETG